MTKTATVPSRVSRYTENAGRDIKRVMSESGMSFKFVRDAKVSRLKRTLGVCKQCAEEEPSNPVHRASVRVWTKVIDAVATAKRVSDLVDL